MWTAGNKLPWYCLSVGLLFAGTLLYAAYRPFSWMPLSPFSEVHAAPLWLHQQLPDGLWSAAFSAALVPHVSPKKLFWWVWWPALCFCLLEALQALGLMAGTADIRDCGWAFAGSSVIFIRIILPTIWKYF